MDESSWDTAKYLSFSEENEEEGGPTTFGPALPIYDEMLTRTGMWKHLKTPNARTVLIGGVSMSISEYAHYIFDINPSAYISAVDINRTWHQSPNEQPIVHFDKTDARHLKLESYSQDAVFTNLLMHWIETGEEDVVKEAHRVLKPGRPLFMVEFENYIELLRKAGFTIVGSFEGEGWTRADYWSYRSQKPVSLYGKYVGIKWMGLLFTVSNNIHYA